MPYKDKVKQAEWREKNRNRFSVNNSYAKYRRSLKGQYAHLKGSAKRQGHEMSISFEEFKILRVLSCHYCLGSLNQTGSGLDRVHNDIGYVKGNVVPCCLRCNTAKGYLEGAGFPFSRILELLQEAIKINKVRAHHKGE